MSRSLAALSRSLPTYREAFLACVFAAITALVSAGLLAAAMLVPAPPDVLPLVIAASLGMPMGAVWQAAAAVSLHRSIVAPAVAEERGLSRPELQALRKWRRQLEQLPEAAHPLGL